MEELEDAGVRAEDDVVVCEDDAGALLGVEELPLPPEVWCLIIGYLGPQWKHLALLSLASRRLHALVWGQVTVLDLSSLTNTASWWRSFLAQRRNRLPKDQHVEAEARDPLEHILRFLKRHSPEVRRLSLSGDFAIHHAPLLMTGLRHLALHHVIEAETTVAATLGYLPHLTSLHLSGMVVTDAMVDSLPASLTSLWVETPLSSFGGLFKRLPPSLTSLRLHSCQSMSVPRFDRLSHQLQVLELNGSRNITGHMLDKLPRGLRTLKLRDCRSIMQAELATALTRLGGLRELDLRGCSIDSSAISFLPASLRVLRLSGPALTDAAVPLLPRQLHTLTLFNMPEISDAGLEPYLADASSRLTSFTLAFCPKITNASFARLPDLVTLKIKGGGRKCRITEDAFQRLPKSLRRLNVESAPFVHVSLLSLPPSVYFVHRP